MIMRILPRSEAILPEWGSMVKKKIFISNQNQNTETPIRKGGGSEKNVQHGTQGKKRGGRKKNPLDMLYTSTSDIGVCRSGDGGKEAADQTRGADRRGKTC